MALTLSLLAAFAPMHVAWAECAWVLWDIDAALGRATIYTVDSAYETKKKCESMASEKASRPWNQPSPQHAFVRFTCLPDTVDPRGPKGGGR
jgi:hypothetical protein